MKTLELFSGLKSFSKIAKERGHETFTIDIEKEFKPDLIADILYLDEKKIPFKPDFIWASPPCNTFSVMSNFREWDGINPRTSRACRHLGHVLKAIEIIRHFNPKFWVIENPRGLLRKFPQMEQFKRDTVTYCQYGYQFMKPTDLWNNLDHKFRPMCKNGMPCHVNGKRGSVKGIQGLKGTPGWTLSNRAKRAVVPEELIKEVLEYAERTTAREH